MRQTRDGKPCARRVVQEQDDAGEGGRGRGRTADEDMLAGEEDPEEVVLCRNVRDALHEGRKAKGGRTAHACRCSHCAHPADYRLCL